MYYTVENAIRTLFFSPSNLRYGRFCPLFVTVSRRKHWNRRVLAAFLALFNVVSSQFLVNIPCLSVLFKIQLSRVFYSLSLPFSISTRITRNLLGLSSICSVVHTWRLLNPFHRLYHSSLRQKIRTSATPLFCHLFQPRAPIISVPPYRRFLLFRIVFCPSPHSRRSLIRAYFYRFLLPLVILLLSPPSFVTYSLSLSLSVSFQPAALFDPRPVSVHSLPPIHSSIPTFSRSCTSFSISLTVLLGPTNSIRIFSFPLVSHLSSIQFPLRSTFHPVLLLPPPLTLSVFQAYAARSLSHPRPARSLSPSPRTASLFNQRPLSSTLSACCRLRWT